MEIYEEKNSHFHHCLFYVLDVQRVDLILQYHKRKFRRFSMLQDDYSPKDIHASWTFLGLKEMLLRHII